MASRGTPRRKDAAAEEPELPPPPRQWLWFSNEVGGRPLALEEMKALPIPPQAALAARIERHLRGESRPGDVDYLGKDIWEIRYREGTIRYRVLFTTWGRHYLALTVIVKKERTTPAPDLARAQKRRKRWRERFGAHPPD